eukprot:CAMPEP_0170540274 /NCGR_PEP_ID=MMETSP0211-20121228/300_1 /TAXON_ID=311385 /ORGANISM="Pseudokeronopsis sp., Strain OXSARD2" /LENGTH=40 /DNA_ID= /DNA_START= /DNA_END= /DNA_ORIENTATION=
MNSTHPSVGVFGWTDRFGNDLDANDHPLGVGLSFNIDFYL